LKIFDSSYNDSHAGLKYNLRQDGNIKRKKIEDGYWTGTGKD